MAAKFIVFAFDATTNVPKTGDAANITAYVSKDYGTVTVLADTTATEMDATNAPGYYLFDAAQGETNADCLLVSGKSTTANIKIIGAPAVIYTRPTTGWLAPTVAARTLDVSAGGEAGVDWANVGSPTTAVDLSGTTIAITQRVDVNTIKTQTVTCGAGVTIRADVGAAGAPGAANGMLIGGSNAATTFAGLTTGALACTTITASGAVAFQSTFAVTTSTSLAALSATTVTFSGAVAFQSTFAVTTSTALGALSCTTLTASGAVAFQSTFAVTTSTNLAALSCSTFAASGTVTYNAFTVTNAMTVSGTTTHTGAVSFGSTFGVTGTTTFAAINTGAIGTGNFTITGTLSTSGTTTLNALTVTNALTVSGTTTLTGAVSCGSTFGVVGTMTVNAFTCTNNFTVSGNWLTTGTTTFTGVFSASAGFVNAYPVGAYYPSNVVDSGTAQSATGTTLVLRAAAAFADSELVGATVVIRSATAGAGQRRVITANVLSTDTITVDAWTTTPTGTIVYDIFGTAKGSTAAPDAVNVTQWLGTAVSTPTVAGVPNVNVKTWNDLTTVALPLVPTTAGRALDVSATGEAGVDWANVGGQSTAVNLSATTTNLVNTVTTYTGNTPQTGDTFALANGASGFVALKGFVDDIGVAGAGLTAIPWNAAWDAEVQSEVDDALVAQRLDELLNADSDIDGAAPPTVGSVFHELMTKTTGSFTFDQTTDSLEALRDNTGTAGAGLTALGDVRIANLDAAVTTRMATYTQPTGFLSATFPAGTVANTTNITAGTITTVTNLTNAATAGDFTAAMKTSLNAATPASVVGAVGSVTGNVGGNVTGSVGSVVGAVGSVTGNVGGTVAGMTAAGWATAFTVDSTKTYADAVAGSVVKEIADNAGGASLTVQDIVDGVFNEVAGVHTGIVATGIPAIKTQTDKLTFTVPSTLDVNIQYVNDVQVNGVGTALNPWGP